MWKSKTRMGKFWCTDLISVNPGDISEREQRKMLRERRALVRDNCDEDLNESQSWT